MAPLVPTKRTGRLVALALAVAALGACTGDAEGSTGPTETGATAGTGSTGPTATGPTETVTAPPGTAVYTYANQGLEVTLRLEGLEGAIEVANGTDHDLGAPDLYALDALNGRRVEGEVLDTATVAAGETATFDVAFEAGGAEAFGLVLLLFGNDNYGAFVRRT